MQFNLRSLAQLFALLSLYLGFSFAIPPVIGAPILVLVTLLLPAATVCGIIYGREQTRAFWIGCASGGFFPMLFLTYYGIVGAFAFFSVDSMSAMFGDAGFYYVRAFVICHMVIGASGVFSVVFRNSLVRQTSPAERARGPQAAPSENAESEPAKPDAAAVAD